VDLGTLFGLIVAFGALAASVLIEGGSLRALVSIPALVIVFGGTAGATLISVPLKDFLRLPGLFKLAFFPRLVNHSGTAQEIIRLATIARRKGLLQLESEVAGLKDAFLAKGLALVIDGTDAEMIRETLETEIAAMETRHKGGAKIFTIMGGLAPTLGVTGTVMGLINMLANVSDPAAMGPAISTAFLATLYGVASANLLFLPVASKLGTRSQEETYLCEILLEGLMGLQAGLSPMVIEERLKSFLKPKERNWGRDSGIGSSADDTPKAEAA
jgi:chemotaxis protein MotA